MPKRVLIIAGETSGDTHGAALVKSLNALEPDIQIGGIGGNRMRNAGMELLYHVRDMSFMGFAEVVRHLPFIRRVMNRLQQWVEEEQPDAVILIDYPGFNLRFARRMKKRDIPVYYYISPQVWAWGKGRLKKMHKLVDTMFVIFPFEEELYREHGVNARFVGHPLVEEVETVEPKESFFQSVGLDPEVTTVGLLPGSRRQEIERHLEEMLDATDIIRSRYDKPVQFCLAIAPDRSLEEFDLSAARDITLIQERTYVVMQHSNVAIVSSGSATLELAYFGTPMVIIYKTSTLTWWLGNLLVDMPYIGLANIVAEKKVLPELLQHDASGSNIAEETLHYLRESEYYQSVRSELQHIRDKLGEPGAGHRVASAICEQLYGSPA